MWNMEVDRAAPEASLLERSQPLVGVDYELSIAIDGCQGLGVPNTLLVPTPSIVSLLDLSPGAPYSYED